MRSIKKRLAMWHIVLIIGMAAIAIPVAAAFCSTAIAVVSESREYLDHQAGSTSKDKGRHSKDGGAVGRGVKPRQDDYYDLRREHWEDRLESRLDYREEYLEGQTSDNDDDAEDSKAGKNDDEDDTVDQEHDIYERRREYWRQRLDKEW